MHVTSVLSEGDIHRAWLEAKWYIAYYPDGRTEIRTGDEAIKQITSINNQSFFQETEETRKTKELVQWLNLLKSRQKCTTT